MTLQQKILAKQSKKGFTLVELVVVIAILAILAAIAIPSVIGIINSATTSSGQSDAASVNNACKQYYAGVVSGSINSTNFTSTQKVHQTPADTNASNDKRTKIANNSTVADAQKYGGLAVSCEDLVWVTADTKNYTKGTILFSKDDAVTAGSGSELDGKTTALDSDGKDRLGFMYKGEGAATFASEITGGAAAPATP